MDPSSTTEKQLKKQRKPKAPIPPLELEPPIVECYHAVVDYKEVARLRKDGAGPGTVFTRHLEAALTAPIVVAFVFSLKEIEEFPHSFLLSEGENVPPSRIRWACRISLVPLYQNRALEKQIDELDKSHKP